MIGGDAEIKLGLEACVEQRPAVLERARFGLLMNRASVDQDLRLACDVLNEAYPQQLLALFTPQHGMWGDAQANMIETPHSRHPVLDVPIYSLYSETRRPTREMLSNLDCLVVDLQDVGTRVYTFIWTVLECLSACAEFDVTVLLLDRPNPIGGLAIEGPGLDSGFHSFVGGASIPMRHGLTIGELAVVLNTELATGAQLEVVPLEGWSRSRLFSDCHRHWLAPSPNLPRFESALVYPGQVLLEGSNLSEGRGTTMPFEVAGAPYVDPNVLCSALSSLQLAGIQFMPIQFRPTFDKWADESCGGVSLHVTDAHEFRPYQTTVALIATVRCNWPEHFAWLDPPYEYETVKPPIDIISGNSSLRTTIDAMHTVDKAELLRLAAADLSSWELRTAEACCY